MEKNLEHKNYVIWRRWMTFGQRTGCHQMPERSFFIKGYQMPVCARCTGVFLGYVFAIPSFLLFGFQRTISIIGCIIMLLDWTLQASKIKPSTNIRRFITGICGGFGIMSIQIHLIIKIFLLYQKH